MTILGMLGGFTLALAALLAQEHSGPHWTYKGKHGPAHWGELDERFNACSMGHRQSPIDIRSAKLADLPPIQFAYQPTPLHPRDARPIQALHGREVLASKK